MKIEDLPWIDIDSLAVVEDWDTVVADARDDKSGGEGDEIHRPAYRFDRNDM